MQYGQVEYSAYMSVDCVLLEKCTSIVGSNRAQLGMITYEYEMGFCHARQNNAYNMCNITHCAVRVPTR